MQFIHEVFHPKPKCMLQLIATPFAFGSVYFGPLWAMITLGVSYLFGKCKFFLTSKCLPFKVWAILGT